MRIIFRADASPKIGVGHVMRCLALAQAWLEEKGGTVTFLMATTAPALEARLQAEGIQVAHLLVLSGSQQDAKQTVVQARALGATWVVVDGYQFGADYQRVIKAAGLRLLFIDDYGHAEHYWADLVLNQNISAEERLYANREPATQLLLGARYALLRKEFWSWRGWQRQIPTVARKVLVTMGGADPDNVTLKVIQALQRVEIAGLEVIVVVGGSNPYSEQLQAAAQDSRVAITLQRNVSNMPELMVWADVAVTAGGSTCWELALMGLPSLVITVAENQVESVKRLQEAKAMVVLGHHRALSVKSLQKHLETCLAQQDLRLQLKVNAQALTDGYGSERVVMILHDRPIWLRSMQQDDCLMLWEWANDPEVRARSFSTELIPWDDHVKWFESKLHALSSQIYIAMNTDEVPLGLVRFDIEQEVATMSITIERSHRGKGYGSCLIKLASDRLLESTNALQINAYIRPDNLASIRSFIKAGFQYRDACHKKDRDSNHAVCLVKYIGNS